MHTKYAVKKKTKKEIIKVDLTTSFGSWQLCVWLHCSNQDPTTHPRCHHNEIE
jgi:hypothetical protein